MSRVFAFILGKGKEELTKMLKEAEEKLALHPDNDALKEEVAAIKKAIDECAD